MSIRKFKVLIASASAGIVDFPVSRLRSLIVQSLITSLSACASLFYLSGNDKLYLSILGEIFDVTRGLQVRWSCIIIKASNMCTLTNLLLLPSSSIASITDPARRTTRSSPKTSREHSSPESSTPNPARTAWTTSSPCHRASSWAWRSGATFMLKITVSWAAWLDGEWNRRRKKKNIFTSNWPHPTRSLSFHPIGFVCIREMMNGDVLFGFFSVASTRRPVSRRNTFGKSIVKFNLVSPRVV